MIEFRKFLLLTITTFTLAIIAFRIIEGENFSIEKIIYTGIGWILGYIYFRKDRSD